jgi:23S rRNA (uracil1939-C5)-methyltransferase
MARTLNAAPQEGQIIDLAQDGRGVAKVSGKTVFIDGALEGEVVRFNVFKRRRQFDEAALIEVLSASPHRTEPLCRHFGVCGGCSLQHLKPEAQLQAKQQQLLDAFAHIGSVAPQRVLEPLEGPQWAYRRRARLGV